MHSGLVRPNFALTDRVIVLAAVQEDGKALKFAAENLRDDRDMAEIHMA